MSIFQTTEKDEVRSYGEFTLKPRCGTAPHLKRDSENRPAVMSLMARVPAPNLFQVSDGALFQAFVLI